MAVVPDPIKGSKIMSSLNEYSWINLYGNSIGKGAGCPILFALSVLNVQIDFVHAIKSSLSIVFSLLFFSLLYSPFENIKMYSCISLNVGFEALCQLPQAV